MAASQDSTAPLHERRQCRPGGWSELIVNLPWTFHVRSIVRQLAVASILNRSSLHRTGVSCFQHKQLKVWGKFHCTLSKSQATREFESHLSFAKHNLLTVMTALEFRSPHKEPSTVDVVTAQPVAVEPKLAQHMCQVGVRNTSSSQGYSFILLGAKHVRALRTSPPPPVEKKRGREKGTCWRSAVFGFLQNTQIEKDVCMKY